ncbi:MAG: hypothetical protein V1831_00595 [Candidatus Woesearchaeota archaeon]
MDAMLVYMRYFFIFVAGVIIGRLIMAIQYAVMKPVKKHESSAASVPKEDKKTILSKEADKFYMPEPTISIISPVSNINLRNKF